MADQTLKPTTAPANPRKIVRSLVNQTNRAEVVTGLVLFGIFLAVLAVIQFSSDALVGTDGYYHIKLAQIMGSESLKPAFTWLPLTILNQAEFYDHHFLYHVALIPFTWFDLAQGAKWASVIFPSLAFLGFWWVLQRQKVPYAAMWALGLLVISEAFLYRMSMVRAQSLSLLVLVLGLHWMFTGKYRWLAPLGFFYVWLYNAFPLLLALAGVYTAAKWLTEGKLVWQPVFYSGLGIGLGLLINPYFPENLTFIYRHLLPKLTDATSIQVGNEWFPYRTETLLGNSLLSLAAFAAGALALGLSKNRMNAVTATAFLTSLMFAVMLFQSRRFIEYYPPFALMFAAFAWSDLLIPQAAGEAGTPPTQEFGRKIPLFNRARRSWLIPAALSAVLLVGFWLTLPDAQQSVGDSNPADRYAEAATWLAGNSPAGARVFQTDWDDFTRLFYYNTHNTYLVGLDPTYLQLYDSILYDLWVKITNGEVEDPSKDIREVFAAQYVFSDLNHSDFMSAAEKDPGLVEIYRDDYAVIYEVVEE